MKTHGNKKVKALISHLGKPLSTRDQLAAFIKALLKKHPSSSEKNAKIAFQAYLDTDFKEILYGQWCDIYATGRSAEDIADGILKAPKLKPFGLSDNVGRGGKRGVEKEWKLYAQADRILFSTKRFLKEWDIEMKPSRFLTLISLDVMGHESINECDGKTQAALYYCRTILHKVWERFIEAYDPKKATHRGIVRLLFGENHPLAKDAPGKGRKVSMDSIDTAKKEMRGHISGKKRIRGRSYHKKFYYLASLASQCNLYLLMDAVVYPERIKTQTAIETILKPFTPAERLKITKGAIEMLDFKESEGYAQTLAGWSRRWKKKPS